jgi:hypothetical protein
MTSHAGPKTLLTSEKCCFRPASIPSPFPNFWLFEPPAFLAESVRAVNGDHLRAASLDEFNIALPVSEAHTVGF